MERVLMRKVSLNEPSFRIIMDSRSFIAEFFYFFLDEGLFIYLMIFYKAEDCFSVSKSSIFKFFSWKSKYLFEFKILIFSFISGITSKNIQTVYL